MVSASTLAEDSGRYFNSFDGARIYYEVQGKGRPILLIHGFIVNSESWKKIPLYGNLLDGGFQVITLDLRGNGRSDKPHYPEAYAKDAEARDIMALVSLLGIEHYSVIGYSRGSIITARLLVLDKRVDHAVLGGMGADFTNPEWPRRILFYRALSGEPVKELEGVVKYIQSSGLDQQALACMQKEQPSTSPAELSKVDKPVLVICGDKDPDDGSPEDLSKMIPRSVCVRVPGDHGAALRSAEFSKEVISFLAK
jgi:pimeloyl-ACP methyl ester carboxylesterase